jgi:hypothetical protein
MLHVCKTAWILMLLGSAFVLSPVITAAQLAVISAPAEKTLSIHDVTVAQSRLLGEITNNSPHRVKDVSLMVQNSWRLKDGYTPKIEAPINAVLFKLKKDLSPGETATFSYVVPLPESYRSDGDFVTDVSVAGFTIVPREELSRFSSAR